LYSSDRKCRRKNKVKDPEEIDVNKYRGREIVSSEIWWDV
jgi:hypothetical protein